LTVSANETAATLTVTATSTEDATKSGTATVTVATAAVTNVAVSPTEATVFKGATQQFTPTVTVTGGLPQTVDWSVNSTAGSAISATGLLTVAAGETAATLTVTATSTEDATKSGMATVTVATGAVTNVAISPAEATVFKGATQQFTPTVTVTGGLPQTVTWSVNSTAGSSISATGLLTVSANETAATLTVTATSTEDATKSGTATVTVATPAVTNVTVSPAEATVFKGATQQFTPTVTVTGGLPQTATWTVNSTTESAISATGLLTVAAGETAATLTVTATSTEDATKSGTATVTVATAAITGIKVTPATATVNTGATQKFEADVTATGGLSTDVEWKVTGAKSAETVIDGAGLLSVAAGETAATLTVRATSVADASKYDEATVTVAQMYDCEVIVEVVNGTEGDEAQAWAAPEGKTTSVKAGGAPEGYTLVATATIDASGKCRFEHLPPGTYVIVIVKNGKASLPSKPVTLTAGGTAAKVNFTVKGGEAIPDGLTGDVETGRATPLQAWVRDGLLHITGLTPGETLSIYSATGALVYQSIATSDEADINLAAPGVYIIRSGSNTIKVSMDNEQ
jgi:hypothetical protein